MADAHKKERITQLHRIHLIDDEIRRGNFPSAGKLAKILGVSERTVNRDLDVLRDYYSAPLEYTAEKRGWFYTEKNFFIKYVQIGEDELFSLALFDHLLLQYRNTPLEKSLKSVFKKITGSLPDKVSVDSSFLSDDVTYIPDALPKIDSGIFEKIFLALRTKSGLEFDYRPLQKSTFMKRRIEPYHVICQRGNWYVIGRDRLKNDIRIFSLSRMINLKTTEKHFDIPESFNTKDYIDEAMGVWLSSREKKQVRLLFSAEIGTFAAEHLWHEKQKLVRNTDGSVEVSFETTQLPEVKRWVLGQGSTVKVLKPAELINEVRKEIKKMGEMYGK